MATLPINPTQQTQPQPAEDMTFDAQPVKTSTRVPQSTTVQPVTAAPQPNDASDMAFDAAPTQQAITLPDVQTATPVNNTPISPAAGPLAGWTNEPGVLRATPAATGSAEKIERFARNLSEDLKYGTDLTGIGTVLKKMGAHGLYSGNSAETGDFLGSIPLGITKYLQGQAEVAQPGKLWQGIKDTGSGVLQGTTIPASFIAPEASETIAPVLDAAGELATKATGAVTDAARSVGKAVTQPFDVHAIQKPLQDSIRAVLDTVAKEAGVTPSPAASIRDVAEQVSTAVKGKASGIYQQLDAATGGRFQRFSDALSNVEDALKESLGVDPKRYKQLLKSKTEIEAGQAAALDKAREAGVNPNLIDTAAKAWRQQAALGDLSRSMRQTVTGMRPELAEAGSSAERMNPKTLFSKVNRLHDTGRLADAIGPENAKSLLQAADSAFLQMQKVVNRNAALKTAAKTVGLGTLGYEGLHALHGLFGDGQ